MGHVCQNCCAVCWQTLPTGARRRLFQVRRKKAMQQRWHQWSLQGWAHRDTPVVLVSGNQPRSGCPTSCSAVCSLLSSPCGKGCSWSCRPGAEVHRMVWLGLEGTSGDCLVQPKSCCPLLWGVWPEPGSVFSRVGEERYTATCWTAWDLRQSLERLLAFTSAHMQLGKQ